MMIEISPRNARISIWKQQLSIWTPQMTMSPWILIKANFQSSWEPKSGGKWQTATLKMNSSRSCTTSLIEIFRDSRMGRMSIGNLNVMVTLSTINMIITNQAIIYSRCSQRVCKSSLKRGRKNARLVIKMIYQVMATSSEDIFMKMGITNKMKSMIQNHLQRATKSWNRYLKIQSKQVKYMSKR